MKLTINGRRIDPVACCATLLFCAILMEGIFNTLLVAIVPVNNILGIALLALCVGNMMLNDIHIEVEKIVLILVIIVVFVTAFAGDIEGVKVSYFIYFLSFGLGGILCSCLKLKDDSALRFGSWMTFIVTVYFIATNWEIIEIDYFSFGYMMMPGIISVMLHSHRLLETKKVLYAVIWIVFDIYVAWITLSNSGRGVYIVLAIFFLLAFFLLSKRRWVKMLCVVAVAAGGVMAMNIETILYSLAEQLGEKGISIYAINKSIRLIERMGDITNGRSDLYAQVFDNIGVTQILFGRGIGEYEVIYGTYTHNLLLSIFADFGIIGIVCFLVLIIRLCMIIASTDKDKRYIYLALISVCGTKLMMSSVYWKSSGFWLLIGLSLQKIGFSIRCCRRLSGGRNGGQREKHVEYMHNI